MASPFAPVPIKRPMSPPYSCHFPPFLGRPKLFLSPTTFITLLIPDAFTFVYPLSYFRPCNCLDRIITIITCLQNISISTCSPPEVKAIFLKLSETRWCLRDPMWFGSSSPFFSAAGSSSPSQSLAPWSGPCSLCICCFLCLLRHFQFLPGINMICVSGLSWWRFEKPSWFTFKIYCVL